MDLFALDDYKEILKTQMTFLHEQNRSFTFQEMAKACSVQKTYLSRVLNRDGDLNADQLYSASQYLGLNAEERNYLFLVFDHQRSSVAERKEAIAARIRKFKTKAKTTAKYISVPETHAEIADYSEYHLDPTLRLIHIFLTLDRFAKDPEKMCPFLRITPRRLRDSLIKLRQFGVIEQKANGWKVIEESLHLSPESPIAPFYRVLARLKSVEKLQGGISPEDYTFSVFFSCNPKTRELIQTRFLEFLRSIEKEIHKSPAEEVYQMTFDLLKWG
jgi:transcriptional regulator with XRE-family HTH domain